MSDEERVCDLLEALSSSQLSPEEVCAANPELLAEVRTRWERLRRLEYHLDALFPADASTKGDDGSPLHVGAQLPTISGYAVESILGRGGVGVVFKARHFKLNRPVALKMLLAGAYAGPDELARFHREAEAVAALRHPNIVPVYDEGEIGGRPYFTMEFVEGGSLAQNLAGAKRPPRPAAELVATLASAVQFAHQNGFIHRDLKPGNILLAADGTPKISDFGLARSIAAGPEFTLTGARLGTPSYMAPEQALGKSRAIGPAVDIYALGAVLYELLTGKPPFDGQTADETVHRVITEEPIAPGRMSPKIPHDLETICLKCLQKNPSRRYADAQGLADDLHRFLDGKPVLARPVGAMERAVKWVRRRPAAALLIATGLLLLVFASGTGLWLSHQEADRQAVQAQREGKARESIVTALARVDDRRQDERWSEALLVLNEATTHVADANSPVLAKRLKQAQADIEFAADLERVRTNSPLEADGYFYYRSRQAEFQHAFNRAGLKIGGDATSVAAWFRESAIRPQLIAALDDWALAAFMMNDEPLAARLASVSRDVDPDPHWRDRLRDTTLWHKQDKLLELAATALSTSPPPTGNQLTVLGLLLRRATARNESNKLLIEACRRHPSNFWLNRETGFGLALEKRVPEAIAYYRAAVALRPENAGGHAGLGQALFDFGLIDEALLEYRHVLKLSSGDCNIHGYLVGPLSAVGRWREAAEECERALHCNPADEFPSYRLGCNLVEHLRDEDALVEFRKAIATGSNRIVTSYLALGETCNRLRRYDEAATAFRKVLRLVPTYPDVQQRLAGTLKANGRSQEAIDELKKVVANPESGNESKIDCYVELGKLLLSERVPNEAATAFELATKLDAGQIAAWTGLAAARLDQGRFTEARAATMRLFKLPATPAARRVQQRQLELCDALHAIETDLAAILSGQAPPTNESVCRVLAYWCLHHKRLPAKAAALYTAAVAAQPSLANDLEQGIRFHAACAAALAGCGVGDDAEKLDDQQRTKLRQQALDWLTAEYTAWAERHRAGKPGDFTKVATAVRFWSSSADFAGVRDKPFLANLPIPEQKAWRALWVKVAALAARDPVELFARARRHISRCEWHDAALCYAAGFELESSDDFDLWYEYGAVQLLAQDRAGYRDTCAKILARCQAKRFRPFLAARVCTLSSNSGDDRELPERLSNGELQQNKNTFWSLTEQGALLVRAKKSQQAIPLLERSLLADGRPGRAILNWLWLSLANQQRGEFKEARQWLDKAVDWLDQQGAHMPLETTFLAMHRHNWLEAHLLRREAEALLNPMSGK